MDKEKGKSGGFLRLTVYAAVFGLIGGMSFQGYNFVSERIRESNDPIVQEQTNSDSNLENQVNYENQNTGGNQELANVPSTSGSGDVSDVVEKALPSIVSISVKGTITQSDIWGRTFEQEASGSGSGIIIGENDEEILIVTNNHVVADTHTVEVEFIDDNVAEATVKGKDSASDLAVVAVKKSDIGDETKNRIKMAKLGDSNALRVGEQAIALGNALGYGTSVTVGIISAKEREISIEDYNMTLLQTDAAINPGNSGGALINLAGEVIGINSVKYASAEVEGMGFAIPITDALPIIEDLKSREAVPESEQAYMGIYGEDVTKEYSERFDMPMGIYVGRVTEGSPAEKAGLAVGQIITGIDGKNVATMSQMQEELSYRRAGDTVKLTVKVMSGGEYKEMEVSVTLGSKTP